MKASNHGDVCHFLFAPRLPSVQRDWFWELWLCFSPLLSHKEYVLLSRQWFFFSFINAHSHYYRPTEQNHPQREDWERLESFFLFCVCVSSTLLRTLNLELWLQRECSRPSHCRTLPTEQSSIPLQPGTGLSQLLLMSAPSQLLRKICRVESTTHTHVSYYPCEDLPLI